MKRAKNILVQSIEDAFANRVFKLSAALAYYTIFSLPGLIIVMTWVSDIFWGHQAVQGSLYGQIASFVGADAANQIQNTIKNASVFPGKSLSAMIGISTLIFGATSVFAEIQDSVNMIWRLKAKPKKGKGWLKLVLDRLLSFSIVITLGFLLLVSLMMNGVMDVLIRQLTKLLPKMQFFLVYGSNVALTFLITAFLFGLIFKVLPDAKIKWKAVRAGAVATTILFMLGRFLIGYYLGHTRMTSAYGAAGSIIIILLWVYYSSVILYFGAAFTRVFAIHHNMHIYPSRYAVWVEQVEVDNQHSIQSFQNDPVVTTALEQRQNEPVTHKT